MNKKRNEQAGRRRKVNFSKMSRKRLYEELKHRCPHGVFAQIADKVGVSTSQVSKVLRNFANDKTAVRPAAKEAWDKIEKAAREVGEAQQKPVKPPSSASDDKKSTTTGRQEQAGKLCVQVAFKGANRVGMWAIN